MKLSKRTQRMLVFLGLAAVLAFGTWYVMNWYVPTTVILPGAPMEMKRFKQNGSEVKILYKENGVEKEGLIVLTDAPRRHTVGYDGKIYLEQTVYLNGIPVKGIYRNEQGLHPGYAVTFRPGENREYVLLLQIDWLVEKHRFLDIYRGKAWRINVSYK